ncbi:hypothetical protein BH11MYX4_BH11MYX4_55310 [soil metagenome]
MTSDQGPVQTVTVDRSGGQRGRGTPDVGAGLVLLYAPDFLALPNIIAFESEQLVVGRDPPTAGVILAQAAISRAHARFTLKRDGWHVTDLDSRNGTLVSGRFVAQKLLEAGDEIQIGDAIYKFVDKGVLGYGPFRIDGSLVPPAVASPIPELVGGYQIARVASETLRVAGADLSVLVLGETGVGKEVVARALHRLSGRRGKFCGVNCAAIPAALVESELFGVKKGAFTGADRDRPGLMRAAHEGTILLDEIGDMPLESQAKLLRTLETREIVPLGASAGERIDLRIVCATHHDLRGLVDQGRFRGDLFARINGCQLRLPPLRERKEDLYLLVRHFLRKERREDVGVSLPYMRALCHYSWPFNVRELESTVRWSLATLESGTELRALPATIEQATEIRGASAPRIALAPPTAPKRATEAELRSLLQKHAGNLTATARELGKDRTQLRRWLRQFGIDPDTYRQP